MSDTFRARIKIAVWPDGSWRAYGEDDTKSLDIMFSDLMDAAPGGESYHWIEADVPLPTVIKGSVT